MNKSIFAGLVILVLLAVAGCRSTAIGIADPAASTAAAPAASPASTPADAPASTPADAPGSSTPATPASRQCFYTFPDPDCTSSDPHVGFKIVSQGDTTGCTFQTTVAWDDGETSSANYNGGADGASLADFTHTYADKPGTYTITQTGQTLVGSCGSTTSATLVFTLTATSARAPSVDAGANQTILGTNIISLHGQVPGNAADVAWTQVSGPGTTNFASSDSAATTATVSTPGTYVFQLTAEADGTSASGQVTVKVRAYVALGDSYSAGDGAVANPSTAISSDYLPGGSSLIPSSSGDASCLQSVYAYPELVDTYVAKSNPVPAGTANPAFTFDACTSAVINDITSDAQKAGDQNVPPQISALEEEPAASVGLVTLTIGGNDAGFGDVMKYCAKRIFLEQSCEDHSKAEVAKAINGGADTLPLEARLQTLYTQIKKVTNTDGQSPLAPGARIIVLGYPNFFPAGQASACPTGYLTRDFQPSDMAWMDNVISQVDNAIQTAAAAAGVTYADTYNAFHDNELCQESPDLNDATAGPLLSYQLDVDLGIQSFHPTIAGQSVLAQNVTPAVPVPTS